MVEEGNSSTKGGVRGWAAGRGAGKKSTRDDLSPPVPVSQAKESFE
jgi:hypothetical protein